MIHTSLSPNTEWSDFWQVIKALLLPWNWFRWRKGKEIQQFEKAFQKYVGIDHAVSFQRGRDALYALLKSLGVGHGHEVILQAYTCIVVPNAIQYTGAIPIYADVEEKGFNIDPASIEGLITGKTRAVIIQHSFGEPAQIEAIQAICRKHRIPLIEDCAHSLSGAHKGQKLGTFGDAAIWSFGRDKIISSVWGGMATTNSEELTEKLRSEQHRFFFPSLLQIKQALLHPLVFVLVKPLYHLKIGKAILVLCQKLKVIPRVIFPSEKKGHCPAFMPQRMPNVLARLAHHQLKKIRRFHQHRQRCAEWYQQQLQGLPEVILPGPNPDSAWLRYTIRNPKAKELLKKARRKGMYLGDWYQTVLAPAGCKLRNFQYPLGSCPRAEKAAEESLNLPTHIQMTEKKVKQVCAFLKEALKDNSKEALSN